MRYAVYFIPDPASALWAFGSSVLGYDSAAVADVPQPSHPLFRKPFARSMVETPQRYGFHATLKAPFRLAEGALLDDVLQAANAFASDHDAVEIGRLGVVEIGRFLALVPTGEAPGLRELAGEVVTHFDRFRAPPGDDEMARRLKSPLTAEQRDNLERWGYPYVFDAFRFHMTLTGPLDDLIRADALQGLQEIYEPISEPVTIDAVAVCEQPSPEARFRTLRRFRLRSSS